MARKPVTFQAHVDALHRRALETLVFFNSRQQRVARGIVNAIEEYGPLDIIADGNRLRLSIRGLNEAQSLFALDSDSGRPLGVAIYTRSNIENIVVLHLSIAEEYTVHGVYRDEHMLIRLLGELRRCSRRIRGIRRMEVYYLHDRLRERVEGRNLTA